VAFGQRPTALAPIQLKKLKAKDPRLAKAYTKQVKSVMQTSGFRARFDSFKLQASPAWSSTLQVDYNKLQKENTSIRNAVEAKLRKLRMGGIPWSSELQTLRDNIELWAMLIKRKKRVQISVRRIRRFLKRLPSVKNAFSCSLEVATKNLNTVYTNYKTARTTEAPQ
jgi:hypothetical protein